MPLHGLSVCGIRAFQATPKDAEVQQQVQLYVRDILRTTWPYLQFLYPALATIGSSAPDFSFWPFLGGRCAGPLKAVSDHDPSWYHSTVLHRGCNFISFLKCQILFHMKSSLNLLIPNPTHNPIPYHRLQCIPVLTMFGQIPQRHQKVCHRFSFVSVLKLKRLWVISDGFGARWSWMSLSRSW